MTASVTLRPFHNRLLIGAVVLSLAVSLWPSSPVQALTSVFINEIHYDNTGFDTGEAIEIAGPAGTDLTTWSIIRYNGANGLLYTSPTGPGALSGVIPDLQNGMGVVSFSYPQDGLQNGSPDGIALVHGTTVVQFLSYEGSFVAANGAASGLSSTDIGVSEPSTSPVGDSLQLAGTGNTLRELRLVDARDEHLRRG